MISRVKSFGRLTSCKSQFTTQRTVSVQESLAATSVLTLFSSKIRYQELCLLSYADHHRTDFHTPAPLDKAIDFPETATLAEPMGSARLFPTF